MAIFGGIWRSLFGPEGVTTFQTAVPPRQDASDPFLDPVPEELQVNYFVAKLLAFFDLPALAVRTPAAFYRFHFIDAAWKSSELPMSLVNDFEVRMRPNVDLLALVIKVGTPGNLLKVL
jgi:hypothetical protein